MQEINLSIRLSSVFIGQRPSRKMTEWRQWSLKECKYLRQDVSCVAEDEENCTEDTEGRTDEMLESDDLWSVSYGIGRVRSVA
ncbi:hypothetical protein X798_05708 [Onchocerca flexuosa]|uniref:Uncharacterized protein n=1 Tax=Onchocerca flexuosa TaxID=387005 RepID=A0A238BRT1_9BILA|nr:hypothetical protein X798_05708 [Onchocerca flexuosa]